MARVFLDTNVLISVGLLSGRIATRAFLRAIAPPGRVVVSDYVLKELLEKGTYKFPTRLNGLKTFLSNVRPLIDIVDTPSESVAFEDLVTDEEDRPILRAAVAEKVDVLLSGDHHFLNVRREIQEHYPFLKIMNPSEFLSRG